MGAHFGELAKIRGIVYYKLSPYEQKAFAGVLQNGPANLLRRLRGSVFRVVPPFILGYMVYDWANAEHRRLSRKNPADYVNDV